MFHSLLQLFPFPSHSFPPLPYPLFSLSLSLPFHVVSRGAENATSILRSNTNNHRRRSLCTRSRSRRSSHNTAIRQHRSTGHVRVSVDDLRSLLDLLNRDGVVSDRTGRRRGRSCLRCEAAREVGRGGDGVGYDRHRRRRRGRGRRGRGLEKGGGGLGGVAAAGEDEVGGGHRVDDGRLLMSWVERVRGVCCCCTCCCCAGRCSRCCSSCCTGCRMVSGSTCGFGTVEF